MATYTASNSVIANPERGYFQYTETHYQSDGSGYSPLSASSMANGRTGTTNQNGISFTGLSIIFRYFYIEKYKTVGTIDQAYLNLLAADLAAVRSAGCKIVMRFAYLGQQNSDSDATPAMVLSHIQQLAPTINQYADIVHAVEAGFIGAWGEWYYTNNFGDSGNVSSQNISDRNSVIDALLNNLDSRIFVLLRYLGSRQTYLNTTDPNPGGNAVRLGHHNDAFTAPYGNYGTYTTFSSQNESFNRTYLSNITNIPVGGESANYNPPDSDWPNASADLANYHFSFLNPNYYGSTIGNWGQTNNDTASMKLGYRFRMVSSTIPGSLSTGGSGTVQVVIANDGYAAPVRNRPVQLVFDDGNGHVSTSTFSTDVRTWAPGQQVTLNLNVTAPNTAGTYNTYLVLPDASSAIAGNALYNIQMANTNTWDAGTGRNSLASPVSVGGGGGGSPTAALSNVSTSVTQGSAATATLSLTNTSTAYVVLYTNNAEQGSRTSSSGGSISLTPSGTGSYTIRVYTAASGGTLLTESPTITVSAQASPSASITLSSTSITQGNPISGTLTLTNTSTGYLSLYTGGAEAGGRNGAAAGSWALTPQSSGTFTVRVYSANTGGSLLAESPQFTVTSSSSVTASFNGVSTSVVVNNPVSGNVIFNGASNGYITLSTGGNDYSPRVSLGTGGFSITPNTTGTYTVRAYANANGGSILAESPSINVTSSAQTPTGSFSNVTASVTLGSAVSGTLSLTNISSAYIVLYTGGNEQGGRTQCNPGSFGLTPSAAGTYTVRAFTASTGGTLLAESGSITVTASSGGGGSTLKTVFKVTVNGVTKTVKRV